MRANGELGLSLIVTVTNIDEDEIMFKKRDRKKGSLREKSPPSALEAIN